MKDRCQNCSLEFNLINKKITIELPERLGNELNVCMDCFSKNCPKANKRLLDHIKSKSGNQEGIC